MPQIYAQINPIILSMLTETLNDNSMEYFEELLRILTFCTFYGDVAPMWPTFPLMATAHELWASDYISDMIPPIDNFISRATETFLSGPYLDLVMKMFNKSVGNHDTEEQEAGEATELIESVLLNCKGRVDHKLPEILHITVQRLLAKKIESKEFRVLLIEIIADSLYYNAPLTLHILETQGTTQAVFQVWLAAIPQFKMPFDIKLIILGLTAIFEIPLAKLPPVVQHGAKFVLEGLITLVKKSNKLKKDMDDKKLERDTEKAQAKKEVEEKKANGQMEEHDDEDSDIETEMHNIPDDQDADAIDSDDDDELAMLSSNVTTIMGDEQIRDLGDESGSEAEVDGEDGDDDEEEEDDDDYDDDDDDDDEEYITPIDRVDELVFFASRIHAIFTTDNASFQTLLSQLAPENQTELHNLIESAKTREIENAQKEQQRLLKEQEKAQQKK